MPVSFKELVEAFELMSMIAIGECRGYVCRQSGKFYHDTDPDYVGELDEEVPGVSGTMRSTSCFRTSGNWISASRS